MGVGDTRTPACSEDETISRIFTTEPTFTTEAKRARISSSGARAETAR